MNHLLLAITLTIATGFNRPTWIDVDPGTGDMQNGRLPRRGSQALHKSDADLAEYSDGASCNRRDALALPARQACKRWATTGPRRVLRGVSRPSRASAPPLELLSSSHRRVWPDGYHLAYA
jgi:hypothetical protein